MVFGQEPMDRKVRVKADGIILKTAINQFWAQVKLPVAFRQKKKCDKVMGRGYYSTPVHTHTLL